MKKILDNTGNVVAELLRAQCANRTPALGKKYFLLTECTNDEISFYSMGASWGGTGENRVPRPVDGLEFIEFYHARGIRCLVIHTVEEFQYWIRDWGCPALIDPYIWACRSADK
jgi:hypothetical protein